MRSRTSADPVRQGLSQSEASPVALQWLVCCLARLAARYYAKVPCRIQNGCVSSGPFNQPSAAVPQKCILASNSGLLAVSLHLLALAFFGCSPCTEGVQLCAQMKCFFGVKSPPHAVPHRSGQA